MGWVVVWHLANKAAYSRAWGIEPGAFELITSVVPSTAR